MDGGSRLLKGYMPQFAIEQAILEFLRSDGVGPGDYVDIFAALHEFDQLGIDRMQFTAGVAQLLSRGAISLKEDVFYLTEVGYEG